MSFVDLNRASSLFSHIGPYRVILIVSKFSETFVPITEQVQVLPSIDQVQIISVVYAVGYNLEDRTITLLLAIDVYIIVNDRIKRKFLISRPTSCFSGAEPQVNNSFLIIEECLQKMQIKTQMTYYRFQA